MERPRSKGQGTNSMQLTRSVKMMFVLKPAKSDGKNDVFFPVCLFSMIVLVSCQSKGEGDEEIEGDVGLELKVNFSEKAVLRNARLSGQWGASETALSFFPFAPGESFKVETRVCDHI